MFADAESILKICGLGSYLQIGCDEDNLVYDLLKRSADAYGIDLNPNVVQECNQRVPGRFFHGDAIKIPFGENSFDTVIIGSELLECNPSELRDIFYHTYQVTKKNLVLFFSHESLSRLEEDSPFSSRLFWENAAIEASFRRHPRTMTLIPYMEHEDEKLGQFIFFETIPKEANHKFSLSWLSSSRDLHMDMLRESGRRSDAHVARYIYAAKKIRPGDRVLDAACGMGYGTAVMASTSRGSSFIGVDIDKNSIEYAKANYEYSGATSYHVCDVTNLHFIEDHSIDVIVSFETIEHISNYGLFLEEAKRVLKPDGRFIGSVPNMWCDETGEDPNPHHYHVFDWEKLRSAVGQYFIIEERVAQLAGGGYKLAGGTRQMRRCPLNVVANVQAEWWLISACGNPFDGKTVPFKNQFIRESKEIPRHVDFGQYYDNPWIYRTAIQLGERISDQQVLIDICKRIVAESKQGSPDHGGALSVIAYQLLESGNIPYEEVVSLREDINRYYQFCDQTNPHAYRWCISLKYVLARLLLAIGQRSDALNTFMECAEIDPVFFSPLIATKTISSHMYAGLILAGEGDLDNARMNFTQAILVSHRVLQGDWKDIIGSYEDPLAFSLPETAEILILAGQCSQAIKAIDTHGDVPGYFWDQINLKQFGLVEWNKSIERENDRLRKELFRS